MKRLIKVLAVPVVLAAFLLGCSDEEATTETVATVNGEKITEEELDFELKQQYGSEVLDSLITNKIIELEADKLKLEVTQEEIDAEYVNYADMYGGEEGLLDALTAYNMDADDIKEDVKIYLLTVKVMEEYIDIKEEDVQTYYDENTELCATEEGETPAFEDVKEDVHKALLEARVNEQYSTWLDEKYKEYEITSNLFGDSK